MEPPKKKSLKTSTDRGATWSIENIHFENTTFESRERGNSGELEFYIGIRFKPQQFTKRTSWLAEKKYSHINWMLKKKNVTVTQMSFEEKMTVTSSQ